MRISLVDVTFIEAEVRHVWHPNNNVLVVTLTLVGLNVHRILVHKDSSVNVLYKDAFNKMESSH